MPKNPGSKEVMLPLDGVGLSFAGGGLYRSTVGLYWGSLRNSVGNYLGRHTYERSEFQNFWQIPRISLGLLYAGLLIMISLKHKLS